MSNAWIDDLTCAALRGESSVWPPVGSDDEAAFIGQADYHGVSALLTERLPQLTSWPAGVREGVGARARAQTFWELRHQPLIAEVLARLGERGIEPVLFKGTALAYGLYRNPVWRARGDTDMIVAPHDWNTAAQALEALGFQRSAGVSGEFVSYQASFTRDIGGGAHTIDLHRRINNSELLSRLFSYDELRAGAVPLPALCPGAVAAGPVDALLLACVHRSTHKHNPYTVDGIDFYGADRLIWLYDIHLLGQSFAPSQWQDTVGTALAKGLAATTLAGIERAESYFGTPNRGSCPDDVRRALARSGEPVAAYLAAGRLRQSWLDFLAIEGGKDRLRFIRELVFPPADYMRTKYADAHPAWLPWLYARRGAEGLAKRLGRHQSQ